MNESKAKTAGMVILLLALFLGASMNWEAFFWPAK